MLYLGADHAGFNLKKELNPEDDYPDFALAVSQKVSQTGEKGILICGTGSGMAITANKIKGVRAVNCWNDFTAVQSREHNDANVLCLGGRTIDLENAQKIVRLWLETKFATGERHLRRLKKIEDFEK